jgi:hypothetical protein
MTDNQKLDQILLTLDKLVSFVEKQEAFNSKQEAFNSKQEAFNSNTTYSLHRLNQELQAFRERFDRFEYNNQRQHDATHKLINQAFEHISDLQAKQPWDK